MLYFAYGSNMSTLRLSYRVGKVEFVDVAVLTGHVFKYNKVSLDGSLKASIESTGKPDDIVYGVLFRIDPKALPQLDNAEGYGNGYDRKTVQVQLQQSKQSVSATTYYGTNTNDDGTNLPYDWYTTLVNAGATEHKLPADYARFLAAFPHKEDNNPINREKELAILKEWKYPHKLISPTLAVIAARQQPSIYTIHLPGHALHDRQITLRYEDHHLLFDTTSPISPGVQTHRELEVTGQLLGLRSPNDDLLVEGRYFVFQNIDYDMNGRQKLLHGQINACWSSGYPQTTEAYQ